MRVDLGTLAQRSLLGGRVGAKQDKSRSEVDTAPRRRPLAPKQQRFVDEYLIDLDATAAAKRAGYSAKSAGQLGYQLLQIPSIASAIAANVAKRSQRTGINADTVLGELLRLARIDIAGAYDEQGRLRPIQEIPEDVRRAISGVEVDELYDGRGEGRVIVGHTTKVKFWDKARALELLARHLGLLQERTTTFNLDPETLKSLSEDQLSAIANGRDPLAVIAGTPSGG